MKPTMLSRFLILVMLAGATVVAAPSPAPSAPAANDPRPGVGPFTSRPPYQAQRLALFDRRRDLDRHAVVFLGDSITEGWATMAQEFPKIRVANLGIASDTTRGMLGRLPEAFTLAPQALVIAAGINDLRATNNPPGTPETVANNLKLILVAAQSHDPKLPVLVCEILPSGVATPELIAQTNLAVARVVAEFPQAVRVKSHGRFLNPDGTQNRALFTDGVHLKPEDYAKANGFTHLDIGNKFLDARGVIQKPLMPDFCHPLAKGYQFWADALTPVLTATK